jgi:hypothetical protein
MWSGLWLLVGDRNLPPGGGFLYQFLHVEFINLATYGGIWQVFGDESPQIAKQVFTESKISICVK